MKPTTKPTSEITIIRTPKLFEKAWLSISQILERIKIPIIKSPITRIKVIAISAKVAITIKIEEKFFLFLYAICSALRLFLVSSSKSSIINCSPFSFFRPELSKL